MEVVAFERRRKMRGGNGDLALARRLRELGVRVAIVFVPRAEERNLEVGALSNLDAARERSEPSSPGARSAASSDGGSPSALA